MINRKVIEQIVEEVLKQISFDPVNFQNTSKPNLLIVGDTKFIEQKQFLEINEKWNICSYNFSDKVDFSQLDKVLFLHASQDLLVKGAMGLIDTPESKLLSCCIFESIRVSIIPTIYLQEHILKSNSGQRDYISQLLEYKDRLLKFGVEVETIDRFLMKSTGAKFSIEKTVPSTTKKRVITQRDVQESMHDVIIVDLETIITPLARDTANELGKSIQIIETKGANDNWKWGL